MKRQKEAMRIMEALSGVDAELLARCEAAEAGGKTADTEGVVCGKSGKNAARWRYLSRCAAVLALLVAGAVSWKGLEMLRSTQNDGDASGGVPEAAAIEYKSNMDLDNEWIGNGDNGSQFPESMISEGMITGEGVQRGDGQKQPASAATDTSVNAAGGTDLLDSVSALGGKDAPGVTGSLDGTEGSGVTGSLDGTEGSGVTGSLDGTRLGCDRQPGQTRSFRRHRRRQPRGRFENGGLLHVACEGADGGGSPAGRASGGVCAHSAAGGLCL